MAASELSTVDYEFLREMLDREVGIHLEDGKEYLAVTRLETVVHDSDLPNLATLMSRLRKNDRAVKADVIDAMTVNETLFFRDPNVWGSIRSNLLPGLIEDASSTRTLRCWSAASSSGQEPYSLSIAIAELLGQEDASWDVNVLASDLSREMVNRTAAGVYSSYEVGRGMDPEVRDRHFRQKGESWQVSERLRGRVTTRQINLFDLPPGLGPFDLIMLRNVLIYFSGETRAAVLRKMSTLLSPSGLLLLGASEGAVGMPAELSRVRMDGLVAFRATGAEDQQLLKPTRSSTRQGATSRPERYVGSVAATTKRRTRSIESAARPVITAKAKTSKPTAENRARRSTDTLPKKAQPKGASSGRSRFFGRRRSTDKPVAKSVERSKVLAKGTLTTSEARTKSKPTLADSKARVSKPTGRRMPVRAKPATSRTSSSASGQDMSPTERLRMLREARES